MLNHIISLTACQASLRKNRVLSKFDVEKFWLMVVKLFLNKCKWLFRHTFIPLARDSLPLSWGIVWFRYSIMAELSLMTSLAYLSFKSLAYLWFNQVKAEKVWRMRFSFFVGHRSICPVLWFLFLFWFLKMFVSCIILRKICKNSWWLYQNCLLLLI